MQLDDYASIPFDEARRTVSRHGYVGYFQLPFRAPSSCRRRSVCSRAPKRRWALCRAWASSFPTPHLLIRPYQMREALSSTRIEGTQAFLFDVLESEETGETPNADIEEVLNYINALEWGLAQTGRLSLSVRLTREMRSRLLGAVPRRARMPGELRTSQNWVGATGSTIETAGFVPRRRKTCRDCLPTGSGPREDVAMFPASSTPGREGSFGTWRRSLLRR